MLTDAEAFSLILGMIVIVANAYVYLRGWL